MILCLRPFVPSMRFFSEPSPGDRRYIVGDLLFCAAPRQRVTLTLERSMLGKEFAVCSIACLLWLSATNLSADELTAEESKFFETKIRPVLINECYRCHSSESGNAKGGLRLDTKRLTQMGGSSGPAIVPGDLDESLLFGAIRHEDFVMPPKKKLSQDVIDDFRRWIEIGAPDPRDTKVAEIKSTIRDEDIQQAKEQYWAYQLPLMAPPPVVENAAWSKTDVDRFVLSRLELSGLHPSADAQGYQVLRRLCFDLIGLPPNPEQIDYFARKWDQSPDEAVAHVVDRLLDQPQFGERWGRHWLDVARYAESTGREVNMTYPHAWRYRDYVIASFNDDKPFDRFVQEQIAGDLLPVETDDQWAKNLVATTFLAIGPKNVNEQNRVQFSADLVDEQIDTTTRVFLGTSVSCARCHDHKFDAIRQADYYAMAGIFGSSTTYFGNPPSEYGNFSNVQARRSSSLLLLPVSDPSPAGKRYTRQELSNLKGELTDKIAEARRDRLRGGQGDSANARNAVRNRLRINNQLATLSAKLAVVDSDGNPRSYCMGVQDRETPQDAQILARGEIDQPGHRVPRGFPQVLNHQPIDIDARSSGRLELARWIGSAQNPLTARVMVNRIWQHLIGQGIVTSTENYGVTGQAPSHPELLDHLAVQFMESGWSVKTMVREIANSRVYRISSAFDRKSFEHDPDNALLWRANPRRLDAEAIRDAMLSISGEMDLQPPRGSVVAKAGYVRVRDGVLGDPREAMRRAVGQMGRGMTGPMRSTGAPGRPGSGDRSRFSRPGRGTMQARRTMPGRSGMRGRPGTPGQGGLQAVADRMQNQLEMRDAKFRSVYLPVVRDEVPRSLDVFDFAESSLVVGTRESSNTANQALYMMNNPFVIQQSVTFAKRVANENDRIADKIRAAFLLAYGRPPTDGEREATAAFFERYRPMVNGRSGSEKTLAAFCQSLYAAAEFRYVD